MNDMLLSEPVTWTREALLGRDRDTLLALFATLAAPAPAQMDGEFTGEVPDYMDALWRSSMAALGKDFWLGKSYTPAAWDGHVGHGLNRYRRADGSIRRDSRFVWDIAPSVVDGRPALVMHYGAFSNWGGRNDLIDEVRVAGPGVWLGIYHTATPVPGFTPRQGGARSALEVFVLSGPTAPFVAAEAD